MADSFEITPQCPTPCDADCDAACHQLHQPKWKQDTCGQEGCPAHPRCSSLFMGIDTIRCNRASGHRVKHRWVAPHAQAEWDESGKGRMWSKT